MYAIVDCNNFYASCERLFRPDLHNKPIVVLSNNDGCVIARSNEAKALGIAMGAPYFKIKAMCQNLHIEVFSSNYTLYGDLSHRVMSVIENEWPEVEQYSIDEAFLNLSTLPPDLHSDFCKDLQMLILKSTGIPTSIGIGATKTLAKAANYLCKKEFKIPVFNIDNASKWLDLVPIGEVWGVGKQWRKKLMAEGLLTAADLQALNPHDIKARFNINLMRTTFELQGTNCAITTDTPHQQSIVSSRSFAMMETDFFPLTQALSRHAATAFGKLRQSQSLVKQISVFLYTNRFRKDLPQYNNKTVFKLIHPTDDLRLITHLAKRCLTKIYKPGFHYKKIGLCFEELVDRTHQQLDFLAPISQDCSQKTEKLMNVLDDINKKFGRHTLKLAAEGFGSSCMMRQNMCSPHYTTRWAELPVIKNRT